MESVTLSTHEDPDRTLHDVTADEFHSILDLDDSTDEYHTLKDVDDLDDLEDDRGNLPLLALPTQETIRSLIKF